MGLNIIVGFFVVILLVVVILIIKGKDIRLFICEKRYGKYSSPFVKMFKRIYHANPYPHAAKSEIVEYISALREIKDVKQCNTHLTIAFGDYQSEINKINVVKDNGEPHSFSIREIGAYTIKIYGYNVSIFGMNALALYFVYKNQLFLGEYIIKRENQKVDYNYITQKMQKKYCSDSIVVQDDRFLIWDANASQILLLDDGFSVRLKYFNFENNNILNLLFAEQDKIRNAFQQHSNEYSVDL
jgi:hypothetical protein